MRSLTPFEAAARFHRSILVIGTVGVSIGASKIAGDAADVSSWLLVVGCAVLVFSSDLCREVEDDAALLSKTSGRDIHTARHDIFSKNSPVTRSLTLSIGVLLAVGGIVGYVTQAGDTKPRQSPGVSSSGPAATSDAPVAPSSTTTTVAVTTTATTGGPN